jgi:nitrogen regulatory protein P-II 1
MLMLVEAVIRPQKVADVKAALTAIGVKGLTITEVLGTGNERGYTHNYRGAEYKVSLVQRIKVEVAVLEREARVVADAIVKAARTGAVGDGKVFLIPVADAQRIRTGEEGRDAIE